MTWRQFLSALDAAVNGRAVRDAELRAAEQAWQRKRQLAAARREVAAMHDWAIRTECTRIQIATVAAERAAASADHAAHPPHTQDRT